MARFTRDPYELTAKFDGVCAETGKAIKKGEQCIYYPSTRKVYHIDSKTAYDFRCWKADLAMGYNY